MPTQIALIGAAILGRTLLKGDGMTLLGIRVKAMWDGMTARISPLKQAH